MTREEIKNTPEIVDLMLDKCILADSRTKLRKKLEEVCDLAIEALEQEPCEDEETKLQKIYNKGYEDCRQAAIDTIESWLLCDDYDRAERHIMRAMQSVLYDLKPVNPPSKTGNWIEHEIKDLSKRVEILEKQMKEDKEEQIKKLKAELDYAKFCCALKERDITNGF